MAQCPKTRYGRPQVEPVKEVTRESTFHPRSKANAPAASEVPFLLPNRVFAGVVKSFGGSPRRAAPR